MKDRVKIHLMENVKCNWNNQAQGICNPWIFFGFWFPVAVCSSVFSKPNDFFQEHNHKSLHKSTEFCCNIWRKINFLLFKKNRVSSQLLQSLCKPEEDKNCNWSHNSLHCEPDFSKSSILVNFLPIWNNTVTLYTCTVNAHMSISDENWSRYNCVYITWNIICNIEI